MGSIIQISGTDVLDGLPLPYLELDRNGIVVRANRATLALLPPDCGELVGQLGFSFLAPDEKDQSFAAYVAALESGEQPEPVIRSVYDRSGQFRTYELHRNLICDGQGTPQGMRVLFVDVTTTRRQVEAAQRAKAWLDNVVCAMVDAVIVTDALGFIRMVNPATEVLLGWKAGELNGKTIEQGMPLLSFASGRGKKLDFTMQLEKPQRGIATVLTRERKQLRVEIETAPIFDKETGYTTGVVSTLRSVDEPS